MISAGDADLTDVASMRPARKGPENRGPQGRQPDALGASMRPARKGPENLALRGAGRPAGHRFNEAGPQGAGKPLRAGSRSAETDQLQ